jgi:hypothetical protein
MTKEIYSILYRDLSTGEIKSRQSWDDNLKINRNSSLHENKMVKNEPTYQKPIIYQQPSNFESLKDEEAGFSFFEKLRKDRIIS